MQARYQYGSAAVEQRKENLELIRPVRRDVPYSGRGNMPFHEAQVRQKARSSRRVSLGYLLFVAVATLCAVAILARYITLRSEIQNDSKRIAVLESRLNSLRQDNDEAYSRAGSGLDLNEVRRIAIQEYGMIYATDGQIITYSNGGGDDYVRQLAPIPGAD